MATEAAEPTVTRKKKYEPTDDDYELQGIRIEKAENGVVVRCEYRLKDEIVDKMKKNDPSGYYSPYCGDDDKMVFEKEADAKAHIIGELNALWP